MKKSTVLSIIVTTVFFSCGHGSTSKPNNGDVKTIPSTESTQSQKPLTNRSEIYIDTQYEYIDAKGSKLIIQNSLPRGGQKYTDPSGKVYIYAVFWTRITNETANPFELAIHFPEDSYQLPSTPGGYLKVLFPSDTMTIDKEGLYNYGLANLEPFLDQAIYKSSSLKRTVNPKETTAFYVVILSNKGVDGILRTGLSLKGENLFYRINEIEIQCGKSNLKNLKLQK